MRRRQTKSDVADTADKSLDVHDADQVTRAALAKVCKRTQNLSSYPTSLSDIMGREEEVSKANQWQYAAAMGENFVIFQHRHGGGLDC